MPWEQFDRIQVFQNKSVFTEFTVLKHGAETGIENSWFPSKISEINYI